MKKSLMGLLLAFGVMGSLAALPVVAQQNGGGNGGATDNGGGGGGNNNNGGGGGGGGNRPGRGGGGFNMQQMMQNRVQRIKDSMQASDDDWKAIGPKVENLMQLQMQSMMGRFRPGRGGPGGQNGQGGDPNAPANPVATAQNDLRNVLDNKDATPEQIKSKLEALRTARKDAADKFKKTQDEVRELLTVRQEAVLVQEGLLE